MCTVSDAWNELDEKLVNDILLPPDPTVPLLTCVDWSSYLATLPQKVGCGGDLG